MREITINFSENNYKIKSADVPDFELLGLLEQIVFDLKRTRAEKSPGESGLESRQNSKEISEDIKPALIATEQHPIESENSKKPKLVASERIAGVASAATPDLRTRISNAVKAIHDLGGRIETNDLLKMSDDELQTELEELTAQYKRLKNSKGSK